MKMKRKLATRWRNADRAQRRMMIVDTAIDLLHRYGSEAVTMRRVAQRLGVGAMTLYTYVSGQDDLRRAMIGKGFEMLSAGCQQASTLDTPSAWQGGSRRYIQFAIENPNLYRLMFADPMSDSAEDRATLEHGIAPLREKIRSRLTSRGMTGRRLEHQATVAMGRFWIALHGLASLAIANRLSVIGRSVDQLLEDLLARVAPD